MPHDFEAAGLPEWDNAGTLGGVPVEQAMWQAIVLRDGKATWWAFFRTEREALDAVRMRE